jgi:L-aminopeptidase/D-esterase-like protein
MTRPGKRNLITDVAGLRVGQAEDLDVRSGVTVLLADEAVAAAVDIRGGAPGTRETDALDLTSLGGVVDAIAFAGGSVYGLDASSGVMAWLGARGRGFRLVEGAPPAPIVPGAIIFDLANGGNKNWGMTPPYRALAISAIERASEEFGLGNHGAGLGARAGIYKGGTGSASAVTDDGFSVGGLAIVNAVGSPIIPHTDVFWAFPFEQDGEFGGHLPARGFKTIDLDLPPDMKGLARAGENTTIAVVATDAALSRVELKRVAIMAADGFARALRPVHAPFDGDTVFALSTGKRQLAEPRAAHVMRLGMIAADCLTRAIARGVFEAQSLGGVSSYRDIFAQGGSRK